MRVGDRDLGVVESESDRLIQMPLGFGQPGACAVSDLAAACGDEVVRGLDLTPRACDRTLQRGACPLDALGVLPRGRKGRVDTRLGGHQGGEGGNRIATGVPTAAGAASIFRRRRPARRARVGSAPSRPGSERRSHRDPMSARGRRRRACRWPPRDPALCGRWCRAAVPTWATLCWALRTATAASPVAPERKLAAARLLSLWRSPRASGPGRRSVHGFEGAGR